MRAIGGLIGNDLGQMRVQFNARDWVIEPAYRDDNLGLWDFEGEPPQNSEAIDLMIDAARVRQEEGDGPGEPSAMPEASDGPGPCLRRRMNRLCSLVIRNGTARMASNGSTGPASGRLLRRRATHIGSTPCWTAPRICVGGCTDWRDRLGPVALTRAAAPG